MSVSIKNVILGEGETKICVPIIGKTKEEILAIKDGYARRKEMAAHPELFGLAAEK